MTNLSNRQPKGHLHGYRFAVPPTFSIVLFPYQYLMVNTQYLISHLLSLVPRPPHSFCRLQYEKRGRPGISYHVNDVEGREEGRETLIEHGRNASNVPTQS